MLLSPEEAKLFFKLHGSLMQFANDHLRTELSGLSPAKYAALPPEARLRVVKAFLGRLDLIGAFVTENPAGLSHDETEIVSAWRHLVAGRFLVLRQLNKHMLFLSSGEPAVAYGVLGLTDPLDRVIGSQLPAMVETVLLPFRGRIIYDGLVGRFNVSFGGGAKRNFEDSYRAAKTRHGIVTSLPLEAATRSAGGSLVARKPKQADASRVEDGSVGLDRIVNMIQEFCQAHLNEEYAALCRKLAEKLARKRPSPLLRGQAETWACGILRTIGWVNFLDDRSTIPFMKLTAIDKAFGVAESTGQGKSKMIRRILKIRTFDHQWTLPSQLESNPRIWLLEINGFLTDIRTAPLAMQRNAYEQGLIPYVPAEKASLKSAPPAGRLYQFKITLLKLQPPIWRRIQVMDETVDKLHEQIQAAMGWTNSHLHQFNINGKRYGDPELLEDGSEGLKGGDSTKTLISQVVPRDGAPCRFVYEYDFGDGWLHEVQYEGSPQPEPDVEYPLCLEGGRACPPEDVGGTVGYAKYLEALGDPTHQRHKEFLQWNGDFKPEAFNPRRATQAMQEGVPDWRTMA